ncbi:amidohydrolase family protein [Acidobacteriota bacterium]
MSTGRRGIGNVHSHQINQNCLPKCIMSQQSRLPVWLLKSGILDILGGRHARAFFRLMKSKDLREVAATQILHMDGAETIDYSIVLTLDFKFAPQTAQINEDCYTQIIKQTAEACAQFPFRFFPFFCYDPRRKEARELLEEAVSNFGYVGIKMYPATGFDPRPYKDASLEAPPPGVSIKDNLMALYEFAGENNLPIITHCSPGGSYKCLVDRKNKYKTVWRFTEPSNFLEIARTYGLHICFAHMGGRVDHRIQKEMATQWHNQIINLIRHADRWESRGRFYADQSYGISHVINKKRKRRLHIEDTKRHLGNTSENKYLLFGTDWPLGLYKFTEKNYLDCYRTENGLNQEQKDKYFSDNIARFLFGEFKHIRPEYIRYLEERRKVEGKTLDIPPWVKEENGSYFLV